MIRIRELSFIYRDSGATALSDVGLYVDPGECVGLVGPAGAGKSTAQMLLAGRLPLQQGHIEIAGCDRSDPLAPLERQLGVLTQQVAASSRATVYETLALAARRHSGPTEDPLALLERLGLRQIATRRVSTLPAGILRRLSLACALVHRPAVLLLDEPLAELAPDERRLVTQEIARQRAGGATILVCTRHNALTDALCGRVVRLLRGRVVAEQVPLGMRPQPE